MSVFVLVAVLVVLAVVLFSPLMLPGAIVVFAALGVATLVRRHHAHHAASAR